MILDERVTDICIVLLTGIGDVVHGLPVANAIKDDDRTRRITWVAEPAPAAVLHTQTTKSFDRCFRKNDGIEGLTRLRDEFRELRFDPTIFKAM